jgi:hypothetical protein
MNMSLNTSGTPAPLIDALTIECRWDQTKAKRASEGTPNRKSVAGRGSNIYRRCRASTLAHLIVLGVAMWCSTSFAQSGAGSVQGTVQDATGAAIPGSSIHVVRQDTGATFNTKSNSTGLYIVPSLFTATYVITYSAPGFQTDKATVELQVAQSAVVNPVLKPGAVTQEVVVSSNAIQLTTTDSGTISSTLENARINQLPMNGRNLLTLSSMVTPGLEDTGQRANGLEPEALEYTQDGASLANRNFGGVNATQAQLPDPDAVQEVKLETADSSAQYSTPGTAIITTKSGTNALHGSLFETARNNGFGIARRRQDPSNYRAPKLVRNEFGASAGGPVIIPRLYNGKDKSFWFLAFERFSEAQTINNLTTTPTMAMRSGDWSGLKNSAGVLQQLYDPNTTQTAANNWARTPFPTINGLPNQIPINRISPVAQAIYDIWPQATSADDPLVSPNLTLPDHYVTVIPNITFRLDHTLNENNRVFLRYTSVVETRDQLNNNVQPSTLAADGFPAGADGLGYFPTATFSAALGYTHIFSSTFFSETNISQQWMNQDNTYGGNALTANYDAMLGLPNNFGELGFPEVLASTSTIMPNSGTMGSYDESQILSNVDENLSKTLGRHQLTFGGRFRHERLGYLPDRSPDQDAYGGLGTALYNPATGNNYGTTANTGNVDADFFLGDAASYEVFEQAPYVHYRDMEFDTYLQDNFHVTKNLTFNLGLRYEAHPAVYTRDALLQSFDLKNKAVVFTNPISYYVQKGYTTQAIVDNLTSLGMVFETSKEAGFPSANLRNNNLILDPRVAFAYVLPGKYHTVVRGGYGRYDYPTPVRSYLNGVEKNVPLRTNYTQSYTASSQSPDGLPNYILRAKQTVIAGANSANVIDSSTPNAILPGVTMYSVNPDSPPDLATVTNVTVEQPIKGDSSALRVSWVYSHGTNLDQAYEYNYHPSTYVYEVEHGVIPPNGTYSSTATGPYDQTLYGSGSNYIEKSGWSNDNELEVNYQRLFHHGSAYQMSYIWSKAFRVGTDSSTGTASIIYPYADYLPGFAPAQPANIASYAYTRQLDRFENYKLDSAIPKLHIAFNGIIDLPVGRGKRFLGNSNRFVDLLVGGFQIAGDGSIVSQDFQPSTAHWGPTNPIQTYKHKYAIQDCRSGVCHKAYMWFNGYLSPTVLSSATDGVYGLPVSYVPYQTPINNTPNTSNYGNDNVSLTLNNGSVVQTGYSPGPVSDNRFSNTFINGPINWTADVSIFKVVPITQKVGLRFNVDIFNVFNEQGYSNPNATDGTESLLTSYNTPRQLQLSLRISF